VSGGRKMVPTKKCWLFPLAKVNSIGICWKWQHNFQVAAVIPPSSN
jgi:hypothetical protein